MAITKAITARLRRAGVGVTFADWPRRAAICEGCHLRVVSCGESYCGKPYARRPFRDEALEGCGCPCRDKAQDATEHCPIDWRGAPASQSAGNCTCKWCLARSLPAPMSSPPRA